MRFILQSLRYCLYVLFTMDKRDRYMAGKAEGKHCYKSVTELNNTIYYYKSIPPYREYMTWKEYRVYNKF